MCGTITAYADWDKFPVQSCWVSFRKVKENERVYKSFLKHKTIHTQTQKNVLVIQNKSTETA